MDIEDVDTSEEFQTDVRLTGVRSIPIRLAFVFICGGRTFWVLTAVCIPLACLFASLYSSRFAPLLFGVPATLFLIVFWMPSYRYLDFHTIIAPEQGTLTVKHPNTPHVRSKPETIELEDVTGISIVPLAGVAMVRIIQQEKPIPTLTDFIISEPDLQKAINALSAGGVSVSQSDLTPLSWGRVTEPVIRIIASPLLFIGIPVYGLVEFGSQILIGSNLSLIFWPLAVLTVVRHLTYNR